MAELFPFRRALSAHKREARSNHISEGTTVALPRHVEALSHLAESRLDVYGIPSHIRCGAKFRYTTGPLDPTCMSALVSEVILQRDGEKWVLESLTLKTVTRRYFFHGEIIPTEAQNDLILLALKTRFSSHQMAF